ncbi:MAG: chemotaxis protein CheW [bacterium]
MINELLEAGQEEIQMIIFQLGYEEYAVPITTVQEIIMAQEATRIPKAPAYVEGVINLRGHIIPVIDGRKKFNFDNLSTEKTSETRVMVLEIDEEMMGLIVDSVSEVVHLSAKDIEPPPIEMDSDTDFLWGVGKYQDRLLILLNPQKFLNLDEDVNYNKIAEVAELVKITAEAAN